jgi:flagellin-like protein
LLKKRAITPVVATVILIAVAVALSIAVAFWAGALTGSFSKYGKLELLITTHYASSGPGTWSVTIGGVNQGSQDVSITGIELNGQPYSNYGATISPPTLPIPVPSGGNFTFVIMVPQGAFTSGQNVQITIITDQPEDYSITLTLP